MWRPCTSVRPNATRYQRLNHLTDLHEIRYEFFLKKSAKFRARLWGDGHTSLKVLNEFLPLRPNISRPILMKFGLFDVVVTRSLEQ